MTIFGFQLAHVLIGSVAIGLVIAIAITIWRAPTCSDELNDDTGPYRGWR